MDIQKHKRVIVLLGVSGAGKGTQSQFLADHRGFQRIVAGDVIREMAKGSSEISQKIKSITEKGGFLDDNFVSEIMHSKFQEMNLEDDIILDGFPRSASQKLDVDRFAKEFGYRHIIAVWIDIPREVAVMRLQKRSICNSCGKIFTSNVTTCDKCGSTNIMIRADDTNLDSINHRIDAFFEKVMPAIELYEKDGVLVKIDGTKTIDEVNYNVIDTLDRLRNYEV